MTSIQDVAEKLNLALRRLHTHDREARLDAYRDIVEAVFLLDTIIGEDPVARSIQRSIQVED